MFLEYFIDIFERFLIMMLLLVELKRIYVDLVKGKYEINLK